MSEHDFVLAFDLDLLVDLLADRLHDAGCDDATISVRDGKVNLVFTRLAASREEAIAIAIEAVKETGFVAALKE